MHLYIPVFFNKEYNVFENTFNLDLHKTIKQLPDRSLVIHPSSVNKTDRAYENL